MLQTLKPAEDGNGLILRLFETHRQRGPVTLRFGQPIAQATIVNLLEEAEEEVEVEEEEGTEEKGGGLETVDGTDIHLTLGPYQIVSLRVVLTG